MKAITDITNQPDPEEEPSTPERRTRVAAEGVLDISDLDCSSLLSPMPYHSYDAAHYGDTPERGAPGGAVTRKFQGDLQKRSWHTLAPKEALEEDTKQIRAGRSRPDGENRFVLQKEGGNKHGYGVHEQGGHRRLFPQALPDGSPSFITLSGNEWSSLRLEFKRVRAANPTNRSLDFRAFVQQQVKSSASSPAPDLEEEKSE